MEWNYKELAATLRASMSSSHPPVVVIEDDGNRYRPIQPMHHRGVSKTLNSIRSDADHLPCVVIGIVKNETTPKVTEDEVMFTLSSSDSHRGGGYGGLFKQGEA